jgi:hypothetical protein
MIWNIHYANREFAFANKDPLLGVIWASTKGEAEAKGAHLDRQCSGGVLATPAKDVTLVLKCGHCGSEADKTFYLEPSGWRPDDSFPILEPCLGCGEREWHTEDEHASEVLDASMEAFNASRPFSCADGEHTYE